MRIKLNLRPFAQEETIIADSNAVRRFRIEEVEIVSVPHFQLTTKFRCFLPIALSAKRKYHFAILCQS